MFKHILLPTDGSLLSQQAVAGGLALASECGASVVAVHVVPVPHVDQLEAWMHHDPQFANHRQALFDKFVDMYLAAVARSAQALKVPCECRKLAADEPYRAILEAAEQAGCDLIYMASHGWKGAAHLLGSQTVKVLHFSQVPVLVHKTGRHDRNQEAP